MTLGVLGLVVFAMMMVLILACHQLMILRRRVSYLEYINEQPRGCQHPETVNVGTFGLPEYRCTSCHQVVEL